ncbi:hypothetical protein [Pelagicoccus sp. SDUM812003]|uniref:hypothetical protein n=1 Tax=Pelagicoccus sp. SDUM812003 TaxID=3041267 RepID=UPI00280FE997|nr:hypothetical protein [Pelagicoccus sp. SDUM812003]MDQ8204571.1 hypothetical protein [Pelagicoccus sp. SDUM812003]
MKRIETGKPTVSLRQRKGFAIVLVAALAGLVFLLGASLVAVSQLQRASAQYDQRMQLARDHARASFEMALGELQRHAGQDTTVTFTADAYRSPRDEDFNAPSDPATSGVYQPFWTGVSNVTGGPRWLVSRPFGQSLEPDPLKEIPDPVTLVARGSAKPANDSDQARHDVRVPKAPIKAKGVLGYPAQEERAIGHTAYWVGDLGVKASYALYDKSGQVEHYKDSEKLRLRQMTASNPRHDTVDTNPVPVVADDGTVSYDDTNPIRIDQYVNDFQFRHRFGSANDDPYFFLNDLTEDDVQRRFHDYTPLSIGILCNTAEGGLKKDLTPGVDIGESEGEELWDGTELQRFSNLSFLIEPTASASNGLALAYEISPSDSESDTLFFHPILTDFNLRVGFWLRFQGNVGELVLGYNLATELWNPYSATLIQDGNIRVRIEKLPSIAGTLRGPSDTREFLLNLEDESQVSRPIYELSKSVWRPGEIALFSGISAVQPSSDVHELDRFNHASIAEGLQPRIFRESESETVQLDFSFVDPADPTTVVPASLDVVLEIDRDGSFIRLATYRLSGEDLLFRASEETVDLGIESDATFAFTWSLSDEVLSSDSFNVQKTEYEFADIASSFTSEVISEDALNSQIVDGSITLLGRRPVSASSDDWSYDIPYAEIPRQELTSVAMLNQFGGSYEGQPGKVSSILNPLFDTSFFSTVPRTGLNALNNLILPNAHLRIEGTPTVSDLQSIRSAQYLKVHGQFNVNSTSKNAWAAILRAVAMDNWQYVAPIVEEEDEGIGMLDTSGKFLFFNFPQASQEVYSGSYDSPFADRIVKLRRGIIPLDDGEIVDLAHNIVSEIRQHFVAEGGRPFRSIEDFLDSAILESAIAETSINDPVPDGEEPRGILTQSTIMNALAPYLSARSETFLIRAYGDAVDPADPSDVWARAYCEAVVRRTVEKHETDSNPSDTMSATSSDAGEFGRKFEVIAFRWMDPADL